MNNPKQNRGRHRNNARRSNPSRQNFDSNGPGVRIRGSATQVYEKYIQMARDAQTSGDPVAAETMLQHAEHYYRLLNENQVRQQANGNNASDQSSSQSDDDSSDDYDDDDNNNNAGNTIQSALPQQPEAAEKPAESGNSGGNGSGRGRGRRSPNANAGAAPTPRGNGRGRRSNQAASTNNTAGEQSSGESVVEAVVVSTEPPAQQELSISED